MNNPTPYLFFNGSCREAMGLYQKILGGELEAVTYGDAQGAGCPPGAEKRIIHAALKKGGFLLMASDTPAEPLEVGDNIQLSLSCESLEKIEPLFKALSQGGEVKMELHDAFWGARFGMLTDRYGIHWMLSCELSKK